MNVEFFERDYAYDCERRDRSVVRKEIKNALWVRISKPSIAGYPAIPFEFEGLAEPQHLKAYSAQYTLFLKSKEPAAPVVKAPVVKAPVEVAPVVEEDILADVEIPEASVVEEESLGAEI